MPTPDQPSRPSRALAAVAALAFALSAAGEEPPVEPASPPGRPGELPPAPPPPAEPAPLRTATPQVELKRIMTNRASAEESTKTTFRAELILTGPVTLLRLDVPYVDKNNDFASDPANAGLGDLKARIRLASFPAWGAPLTPFLDTVFPTAAGTLGGGKWQLGPGVSTVVALPAPWGRRPALFFLPQVQEYLSVAGDPDRKDVSYTQLELKVEARWPDAFLLGLNPKPVVDWVQGGKTAAVIELQATWLVTRHWRAWVKGGRRLWGGALPTTYDDQLELGVRWTG